MIKEVLHCRVCGCKVERSESTYTLSCPQCKRTWTQESVYMADSLRKLGLKRK